MMEPWILVVRDGEVEVRRVQVPHDLPFQLLEVDCDAIKLAGYYGDRSDAVEDQERAQRLINMGYSPQALPEL